MKWWDQMPQLFLSILPSLFLSQNLLQCGITLVLICSFVDYLTSLGEKMPLQGKLLLISVYLPDINDIYNLYYELHTVISVHVCELLSHVRLYDPINCSPPGSSLLEISQTRTLVWVTIPFSRRSPQPREQTQVSHVAGRIFTV